jgi:hypothetical protein
MARKRTRHRAISYATLPGESDPHAHTEYTMMRVCKIDCDEILRISPIDMLDMSIGMMIERVISWLSKDDGDAIIFRGFQGLLKRPDMGESDIKIPYYIGRFAEMAIPQGHDCGIFVSCWDTDSIPIILLSMEEMKLRRLYCSETHFSICGRMDHIERFPLLLYNRTKSMMKPPSKLSIWTDYTKD